VITNADFLQQPNGDDLASVYPDRAQRLDKTGSAVLHCIVNAQGKLTSCSVSNEDPPGYDFGEAAIKASKFFKLKPATSDGRPIDGATFSRKIVFRLAE